MTHLLRALLLISLVTSTALAEDRAENRDDPARAAESDDQRVPVEALPAVCRDAVLAAWPGAELRKVERDGADYEVGIRDAHGHVLELRVSAAGVLLDQERELERERGRAERSRETPPARETRPARDEHEEDEDDD